VEIFIAMNLENKISRTIEEVFEEARKRNEGYDGKKTTLEKFYGCLIRGYDGLEYQRKVRYGLDDD